MIYSQNYDGQVKTMSESEKIGIQAVHGNNAVLVSWLPQKIKSLETKQKITMILYWNMLNPSSQWCAQLSENTLWFLQLVKQDCDLRSHLCRALRFFNNKLKAPPSPRTLYCNGIPQLSFTFPNLQNKCFPYQETKSNTHSFNRKNGLNLWAKVPILPFILDETT